MLQPFWWASAATVPAGGYWSNEYGWRHPSSNSVVRRRPAASARGVMTSGFQRTVHSADWQLARTLRPQFIRSAA